MKCKSLHLLNYELSICHLVFVTCVVSCEASVGWNVEIKTLGATTVVQYHNPARLRRMH